MCIRDSRPAALTVTAKTRPRYVGDNAIITPPLADDQDSVPMNYNTLPKGGEYCDGGAPKILVGGTITFNQNGQCVGMPTKADGSACCAMEMWQPSNDGFYYDNCSMKCATDTVLNKHCTETVQQALAACGTNTEAIHR